jgi:hypothetical protein
MTSHKKFVTIGVAVLALALAGTAAADVKNSIQPGHVYFGTVVSGQHPVKIVRLLNRSGHTWVLKQFTISGAGGYKFTVVKMDGTTCAVGETLKTGESCQIGVRVHTVQLGWFRAVLRAIYNQDRHKSSAYFGSASLEAHVVAP